MNPVTSYRQLLKTFTDSKWYVADPDVRHVPVKGLLSKVWRYDIAPWINLTISQDYLASRAKLIDPRRANPEAVHVRLFSTLQL